MFFTIWASVAPSSPRSANTNPGWKIGVRPDVPGTLNVGSLLRIDCCFWQVWDSDLKDNDGDDWWWWPPGRWGRQGLFPCPSSLQRAPRCLDQVCLYFFQVIISVLTKAVLEGDEDGFLQREDLQWVSCWEHFHGWQQVCFDGDDVVNRNDKSEGNLWSFSIATKCPSPRWTCCLRPWLLKQCALPCT